MRAFSAVPSAASLPPSPSSAAAPPLTPDAAAVLSRAAGDASRRRHAHTTPLHAAAALLSGPAPLLRDACAAGLASPHPLRCRALDLCFAVALDRLPTSSPSDSGCFHGGAPLPPPLSNALSAALKRAYAHHRRIGGEAAAGDDHRVGVPHLVLAILDDPSVARVMREASFSSTAVKAAMLRSLSDPDHSSAFSSTTTSTRLHHRQWQDSSSSSSNRDEEVAKVVQVLKRSNKRNPVLVGDTADVDAVVQEVVTMIQRQRLGNARVISLPQELGDLDRSDLVGKIRELGEAIRSSEAALSQSIVVNLGNLEWLVEERRHVGFGDAVDQEEAAKRREVVLDTARAAVAEMARVLEQCGSGSGEGVGERRRVWMIGTATCATYVKCQVHHPALESQWDIQAVPVAPRPPPTPSPSVGVNRGILSSSVEVLSSAMSTTGATSTHRSAPGGAGMCAACVDGYDRERAEMMPPSEHTMSRWLQIGTPAPAARPPFDVAREADELRRRWLDRCAQLHSHARPAAAAVTCSEWNGASILGSMQAQAQAALPVARPSAGTVDTALALGSASASASESDETTKLARRLAEAVTWQPEAAAAVASTIAKARRAKGAADTWVLFAGPDAEGKRRMAEALSVSVFGAAAVTVRLASSCSAGVDANGGESIVSSWTAPARDRVAEAARANPFRVVVLDGLDHADDLVRAAESGRLADSRGLGGGAIFVVMSSWSSSLEPDHLTRSSQAAVAPDHSSWNLELRVRPLQETTPKRCRPEQPLDINQYRRVKPRKTPLPLDLNLSMCGDEDDDRVDEGADSGGEGSRNSSSDLTVEHELEPRPSQPGLSASMRLLSSQPNVVMPELIRAVVDGIVEFKPAIDLELEPLKRSVSAKFGGGELLDRLAGAATWTAGASATSLVAWADEARCRPSVRQMKRSTNDVDDDDGAMKTLEGVGRGRMDGAGVFPPLTETN